MLNEYKCSSCECIKDKDFFFCKTNEIASTISHCSFFNSFVGSVFVEEVIAKWLSLLLKTLTLTQPILNIRHVKFRIWLT